MSLPQRPIPRADGPGFRMLHHFYYYCSAALIPDPLQAEDAPLPSPRPRASHAPPAAPRPQASGPAPRPPRRARVSAPAPPRAPAPRGDHPLPAEPNQQRPRGRGREAPSLLSGRQLTPSAVTHKVALAHPPSSLSSNPPLQGGGKKQKRRLGHGGRQRRTGSGGERSWGAREGGLWEEQAMEEEEGSPAQPEPSPPRTKWRRWRRANCEAGPRCPPSAPTLAPAGPVRGSPLASPAAGGEGRGAARPTMQSGRRHRPVAKVKGSGSAAAAAAAPPCPRARPAPSAAGPSPPRPFFFSPFNFYLRIWRQSGLEAGPVSAAGRPPARRAGRGGEAGFPTSAFGGSPRAA